jgi:two-component system, NarL family, response regulator LiaR
MIRVLVVDDHKLVRQGLRFLLEQEPGFEVVGECSDGGQVGESVRRLRPDVVLLDLIMPGVDGITALRELKLSRPGTRVVILTSHRGDDRVLDAVAAGADCYLLKTAGVEDVISTVRAAAAGQSVLHSEVAARVLRRLREPDRKPVDRLSRREVEVLVALARGRSNKEIATELAIGEQTVKTHVSNILDKLHLQDRTQAAIFALRQRLVPLDD